MRLTSHFAMGLSLLGHNEFLGLGFDVIKQVNEFTECNLAVLVLGSWVSHHTKSRFKGLVVYVWN